MDDTVIAVLVDDTLEKFVKIQVRAPLNINHLTELLRHEDRSALVLFLAATLATAIIRLGAAEAMQS